ncbi:MAG: cold-shock protein [Alphaproteobacteria bacterium]|nr:cold-shock protein [Alphaproteobacteria bacterium]
MVNITRDYGFIEVDGGGSDVFVHITAVERAGLHGLADGQRVRFEPQRDQEGRTSATAIEAVS